MSLFYSCPDCVRQKNQNVSTMSPTSASDMKTVAEVNFHFLDVRNVNVTNFHSGAEVATSVKVRNADVVSITDSYFE